MLWFLLEKSRGRGQVCANSCSCSRGDADGNDKDDQADWLMGGQCYLAPRFKALNSCQLDRDLGLMRMTASAGQVRPLIGRGEHVAWAGSCVGDKDETSSPL